MRQKKNIKRIVTRTGEVRYFSNGKRLKNKSGQRLFVKANPNLNESEYSKKELRSLKSLQRYNEGWKFNGVSVQSVYIELLKAMSVPVSKAKNKDLATITNADGSPKYKNFSDILKLIDAKAKKDETFLRFCTEKGLPGYRNRDFNTFKDNSIKNIVDFVDLLNTDAFKNYKVKVIDPDGETHQGRVKGILAIRDFEIMVGEKVKEAAENSAFTKFCYDYKIDFKTRTIIIDLTDINANKDIKDYINDKNSKQGDSIVIKGKYKDVIIEIMFS